MQFSGTEKVFTAGLGGFACVFVFAKGSAHICVCLHMSAFFLCVCLAVCVN